MLKKKKIGSAMDKKGVCINILMSSIYTLFWTFLGVYLCIGNTLKLSILTRIIVMSVFSIILLLIQIPMIGATQRIEFSGESIEFYYVQGWIPQFREVIRILKGEKEQPAIQIAIKDIDTVNISYRKTRGGFGLIGYIPSISFVMKNRTLITLSPENMSKSENGIYLHLINLLSDKQVIIYDHFHLRNGLIKDSTYFQNYVEKMERREFYD